VQQYILAEPFPKLVLEIDSIPGFEPRSAAETDIIEELGTLLDKPGGISSSHSDELVSRGSDHAWTDQELFEMADDTFNLDVDDTTAKMHILFVDGHSARDSDSSLILGLAWSNTHLVMFKDTIDNTCKGGLTPPLFEEEVCEGAEYAIWLHELGHVMGLVNAGLPMVADHQDEEHGAHDASEDCVMYWAFEGEALVNVVRDSIVNGNGARPGFDAACLADIEAVRSSAN
jgi:hypothetical protein